MNRGGLLAVFGGSWTGCSLTHGDLAMSIVGALIIVVGFLVGHIDHRAVR